MKKYGTDPCPMSRQRSCGALAAVAWALGLLVGAMGLTPVIAVGQSPSTRSCNRSAFTGRVGPARPSLCQRQAPGTSGPRGPRGHAGARGQTGFAGLPGPSGPGGLRGLLGAAGSAGQTGVAGAAGTAGSA